MRNLKQNDGSIKKLAQKVKWIETHGDILGGLAVVLQDDGDVHVDDDEETDDEICEEEGDCHDGVATVALVTRLWIS